MMPSETVVLHSVLATRLVIIDGNDCMHAGTFMSQTVLVSHGGLVHSNFSPHTNAPDFDCGSKRLWPHV
jgi:hypothetical protein